MAARKAEEEAMRQRARDQARLQEELDRRKSMEEELRAQQERQKEDQPPPMEGDVYATLERLQKVEQQQREEIQRLTKELDRSNRVWEMKLAILQRNFHSLKNECFLRSSLHRQAATLHHATVGYAVSNGASRGQRLTGERLQPLPQIGSSRGTTTDTSQTGAWDSKLSDDSPLSFPPPPSPLHSAERIERPPSRSVHFGSSHSHTSQTS